MGFVPVISFRSAYHLFESLDARPGDVVVKRDLEIRDSDDYNYGIDINTYGIIEDYDALLRKIDVKVGSGTLNAGDEVHIFRKPLLGDWSEATQVDGFGASGCYQPYFGATTCMSITGSAINDAHPHWGPLCATQGCTFARVHRKDSIKNSVE